MIKHYKTPEAFRTAWQTRQQQRAKDAGVPFQRLAQIDLYSRFLARVIPALGDGAVVVKGGVALEMRLQRARTTLDVDLHASGQPDLVYQRIRAAGLLELDDFLTFRVEEPSGGDELEGDGVTYEGRRFRVQPRLAGKPFLRSFGLDVAFGDPMVGPPDKVSAPDALSFMGIAPPVIPIYPIGTHLAEKFHAYTLPRSEGRENSRLKDLVDIALVSVEPVLQPVPTKLDAATILRALHTTFAARNTHELPSVVPPPPGGWAARYPRAQAENQLPWSSIDEVREAAARFLDSVLTGTASGVWNPGSKAWLP